MTMQVLLGPSHHLSVDTVTRVARGELNVALDSSARELLRARRDQISRFVESQAQPAYGFNRGFGHNVDNRVPPTALAELQKNLIRSHSAGVGPAAPKEIVRGAMLLRAQSLAQGHSGVRPEVVDSLAVLLNSGVTPFVPTYGSVGASGDLAPLSHIALTLMGEGLCFDAAASSPEDAGKVLARRGIRPLELQMKEGLALNNGVQFSNAIGMIAAHEMRHLIKSATLATALSCQVMLGSDTSYDQDLLALRPHAGIQIIGGWLRTLIAGSPLREVHRPYEVDGEIQDPYNLRCAPQVLGTCYDLIEEAVRTFEIEANSVTDNPLILANGRDGGAFTRIVSGGHFHGMPVAVKLYNLLQAMGIMARLSNMRCVRYVDQARNKGLPSDLVWPGTNEAEKATLSGMMIPEYVSAALTNAIWAAAMPSHLFSLSTDAGQEDHVSMSATLAVRVYDIIPRLAEVIAIELAFASQAAAIRKVQSTIPSKQFPEGGCSKFDELRESLRREVQNSVAESNFVPRISIALEYQVSPQNRALSPVCESVLERIKDFFPEVRSDRELSSSLMALAEQVRSGALLSMLPAKVWGV